MPATNLFSPQPGAGAASTGAASTGLFGQVQAPGPISLGALQGERDVASMADQGSLALHARHDAL
jgi:hypothetical protein